LVPGEDRVGRDQGGHFLQSAAVDRFTVGRNPTALRIRETEESATELLLEDAILLTQTNNDSRPWLRRDASLVLRLGAS